MYRSLHFIHGVCPGASLKQAVGQDDVIVLGDLLSYGPLYSIEDILAWDEKRTAFWKKFFGPLNVDCIQDFSRLISNQDRIKAAEKIVLWIGPSLDEQFFFVWIVRVLSYFSIDMNSVLFVPVYEYFPKASRLGNLSSEELHQAGKNVRKLSNISLILETWQYVCSKTPEWDICSRHVAPHYPLLAERLRLMICRFPSYMNGLDKWSTRILQAIDVAGPRAVNTIGEIFSLYSDEPDIPGDMLLTAKMLHLGSKKLVFPLVSLSGELPLRTLNVELTDVGKRVLQQDFNNVTLNGIDEWVSGKMNWFCISLPTPAKLVLIFVVLQITAVGQTKFPCLSGCRTHPLDVVGG